MFAFGSLEILLVVGLVLALLLWLLYGSPRWVAVDDSFPVRLTAEQVEVPLTRLLSGLPASRLTAGPASTWTLSVTRVPPWATGAALLFAVVGPPYWALGVVVLLLAREHTDLQVLVRSTSEGTRLLLIGNTRHALAGTLREAVTELEA